MTSTTYLQQFDLSDKVAMVTGGSDGIGRGICSGLGMAGAAVAVVARAEDKIATAVNELRANGIVAMAISADVREERSILRLFESVTEEYGRIDILVNCAGGAFSESFRSGPLMSLHAADFLESYRLNVVSAFLCSQAAAPIMLTGGGGVIINISSASGRVAAPNLMGAYGSAKAALNNLTRTMAVEFAPIRVNCISPGHVDTPRTRRDRTPDRVERAIRASASGRMGTPADIAGVACFLASPAACWISGAVIDVDGGRTLEG